MFIRHVFIRMNLSMSLIAFKQFVLSDKHVAHLQLCTPKAL